MFKEIGILFSGMPIQSAICLTLGFIFILIEIFQPGFGIFGVIGAILSVVGIVLRVIVGDGNVLAQIFIILFMESVLVVGAFLAMVWASKKGWLNRSALIENKTAIDKDFSEGTVNYTPLIGKEGLAVTDLRPSGRVSISGTTYDVVAEGFYIKKGENVKVTSTEGVKINVDRIN